MNAKSAAKSKSKKGEPTTLQPTDKRRMSVPTKPRNVAEYLSWQMHLCGKTNAQIAEEAGFPKPNILAMIRSGATKLPLNKIGTMAKALGIDPAHLLQVALSEYNPGVWMVIEEILGKGQPILTMNELEILRAVRESGVINPKLATDNDRRRLRDLIATLPSDNV